MKVQLHEDFKIPAMADSSRSLDELQYIMKPVIGTAKVT